MNFKEIELVIEDDQRYKEFCSQMALAHSHLRDSLEATASQKISEVFEECLRQYFKSKFSITECRILRYLSMQSAGGYSEQFREIDVVFGDALNPLCFVEIKASSNITTMIKKAHKQSFITYKILRSKWLNIQPVVLIVALGNQPKSEDYELSRLEVLDQIPTRTPQLFKASVDIPFVAVIASELWDWSKENSSIELSQELYREAEGEANKLINLRLKRRALINEGIPEDEWPKELTEHNKSEVPDLHTHTSSDDQGKSEMQLKLEKALKQKGR
jgi:hypothetical protein